VTSLRNDVTYSIYEAQELAPAKHGTKQL